MCFLSLFIIHPCSSVPRWLGRTKFKRGFTGIDRHCLSSYIIKSAEHHQFSWAIINHGKTETYDKLLTSKPHQPCTNYDAKRGSRTHKSHHIFILKPPSIVGRANIYGRPRQRWLVSDSIKSQQHNFDCPY